MDPIDYFAPIDPMTDLLQRIKGEHRRALVQVNIASGHFDDVPDDWKAHELTEGRKSYLQALHPRMRGGEDLPDLAPGEVELARLVLLDSIHGEVTSLRARRLPDGRIDYTLVDEYGTAFTIPIAHSEGPLTDDQVVEQFRHADPSPMDTECAIGFRSLFHPELDAWEEEEDDDQP
jgi:hypothetical protein